jgi:hypothetical protein
MWFDKLLLVITIITILYFGIKYLSNWLSEKSLKTRYVEYERRIDEREKAFEEKKNSRADKEI